MGTSQIQRISTGLLNTVQDTVIGGTTNSLGTGSATAGQLGKTIDFDPAAIATAFDPTVSTLYPGTYQYVLLSDAEPDSPALTTGQLLYFVTGEVADYVVSSTSNSGDEAGYCCVPGWTPGTYGFIFQYGQAAELIPDVVV